MTEIEVKKSFLIRGIFHSELISKPSKYSVKGFLVSQGE